MSARAASAGWRPPVFIVGLSAAAVLTALSVTGRAVTQGWLIAFVFVGAIPLGSLVLLLIHRLTGGRWGDALAPVLMPAASMVPLVALAFLPLAFALSASYGWVADASSLRPRVAQAYLNQPAFLLRSAIALLAWSALAVLVVRQRCTMLLAAIGLVFHGLAISVVAVDWILSLDSRFSSSAFPAALAVQQLLSALAFAAIARSGERENQTSADLAGLMMATLLGIVYLELMSFIVIWYGNLPDKAAWYLARQRDGWQWVITAAIAIGALLPFCLLLKQSFRQSVEVLRVVGALILFGVFLHVVWLIAPAFGGGSVLTAAIATIALVGLGLGVVDRVAGLLRGAGYAE